MNLVSRISVAAALGLMAPAAMIVATPAFAQALSPAVGKPLQAAAAALKSRNSAAALKQVEVARRAAKTPAERQKVSQMAAAAYTAARQYGRAAQELESIGASPRQLAPLYYQAGNYGKAIQLANKAGGSDMMTIVAQSYYNQGKFDQAAETYQRMLKANPNNERALENLAAAQFKTGDKAAYLKTTERLIRVDPSPQRWRTLLLNLKKEKMSREAKLALYELMKQTNNITRPEDYQEYAKLAIVANQPGVAKSALSGDAVKATDSMTASLIRAATERSAKAMAEVGRLPNTPAGQLQAGNTYFGAGDYAKAAAAYARAGNSPTTQLQLGIAQLRAGQAATARSTFKAIPENSPVADVAALWSLYASTKA